jgi:hypothetical protein
MERIHGGVFTELGIGRAGAAEGHREREPSGSTLRAEMAGHGAHLEGGKEARLLMSSGKGEGRKGRLVAVGPKSVQRNQ